MRLSILIPCYNEAETIEAVVARVVSAPLPNGWDREILVVDDGSQEPTRDALLRVESAHGDTVRVIYRAKNGGKGAAVKDGMRAATGDYIVIQDADLEYNPDDIHMLVTPIHEGRASTVFGSRALGRNNVPYNAVYFYGGLLVTRLYNVLFFNRLTDIASCYKIFSREHVPALLRSSHDDFVFDAVDLTHTLVKAGPVHEVPISYTARTKRTGKKLNWKHGIDIVLAIGLTRLGVPSHRLHGAGKALRFLIAGVLATVANLTVLVVLTEVFNVWYLVSSGIAFVLAFGVSFTMQKYWAFRNTDSDRISSQLPMHLGVALFNLLLDIVLVYAFVEYVGMWYLVAQIVAAAIISIESFFAFRWIYR